MYNNLKTANKITDHTITLADLLQLSKTAHGVQFFLLLTMSFGAFLYKGGEHREMPMKFSFASANLFPKP